MVSDTVQRLLGAAGIQVNGVDPWDIRVHDARFYGRVLAEKNLGLGESYMDGWWDCPRIDEMICRLLRAGIEDRVRGNLRYALPFIRAYLFNLQKISRARIIAERHYDTGNDLFFSFLDPYNQYSCAFF